MITHTLRLQFVQAISYKRTIRSITVHIKVLTQCFKPLILNHRAPTAVQRYSEGSLRKKVLSGEILIFLV